MDIQSWLNFFMKACQQGDGDAIARLFNDNGMWRDYLAFDLNLQTIEGRDNLSSFAALHASASGLWFAELEQTTSQSEGAFTFKNKLGSGRGFVRLDNTGCCEMLFTQLQKLDEQSSRLTNETENPFVLVVGGGQGGLALAAQLSYLKVPYLIVDKYPKVGDQWRSRYDSLVLHDPVWYDHLPFKPFPASWPVFTPKDKMGDFLEGYARDLSLNIWTNTELTNAQYDEVSSSWTAQLNKDGTETNIRATHLVMALGLSGFPHTPQFAGQQDFNGLQLHSSQYKPDLAFGDKNIVVVGANNSAHDIAANLVELGAKPVMLQRSSTLVVKQTVYCEKLLGKLYSQQAVEQGISADEADFLFSSVPLRELENRHRDLWKRIAADDADYYERLTKAGFTLDFAEDGTGLGLKYRRTASGYYIDVGASEMVIDGRIDVRSGVSVACLGSDHVQLNSGETIPAEAVIYATGFGNMSDWVAKLVDQNTADKVGPCWGYGSGTKGDPAPWLGELRNMWKPTAQTGLWFMGGNLAQARYFSAILALQLKARLLGVRYH